MHVLRCGFITDIPCPMDLRQAFHSDYHGRMEDFLAQRAGGVVEQLIH